MKETKNKFLILDKSCKYAVKKIVREDLIEEAEMILIMTTDKNREDFMKYFKEDNGNLCCLVIDFAKQELVKEGRLTQKDTDAFGKPLK